MKKLIIGFSKPKNNLFPIFSWLIRLFQGCTKYSHIYVRWYSEYTQQYLCYQASGLQVNFVGEEVFNSHIDIVHEFEIEITEEAYKDMVSNAIKNSGKPYGIKQILGILIALICNLKYNIFADKQKTFVCSELIAHILKDLKIYNETKDLDLITPKDIYNYMISCGYKPKNTSKD